MRIGIIIEIVQRGIAVPMGLRNWRLMWGDSGRQLNMSGRWTSRSTVIVIIASVIRDIPYWRSRLTTSILPRTRAEQLGRRGRDGKNRRVHSVPRRFRIRGFVKMNTRWFSCGWG